MAKKKKDVGKFTTISSKEDAKSYVESRKLNTDNEKHFIVVSDLSVFYGRDKDVAFYYSKKKNLQLFEIRF